MPDVSPHYYIGAVTLAIRLYNTMPVDERDKFDEAQGSPMVRLAADFNARNFSVKMIKNGARWMLFGRNPVGTANDPES